MSNDNENIVIEIAEKNDSMGNAKDSEQENVEENVDNIDDMRDNVFKKLG